MPIEVNQDWWKLMFDEVYLQTDARSVDNAEITCREVDLICRVLPIRPEHKILDLCGGHGRHSLELCARGFSECTLLDFSEVLLEKARNTARDSGHNLTSFKADARDTGLETGSFDHVLILGNSLGYIKDQDADKDIIAEALRLLKPGGWLLADVTDGAVVKQNMSPRAWHETEDDLVVCRERELHGNEIRARELVLSKSGGLVRDLTYAIRLFEPPELESLLLDVGFTKVQIQTGFSPHQENGDYGFMNHRMIALGQKA